MAVGLRTAPGATWWSLTMPPPRPSVRGHRPSLAPSARKAAFRTSTVTMRKALGSCVWSTRPAASCIAGSWRSCATPPSSPRPRRLERLRPPVRPRPHLRPSSGPGLVIASGTIRTTTASRTMARSASPMCKLPCAMPTPAHQKGPGARMPRGSTPGRCRLGGIILASRPLPVMSSAPRIREPTTP